MFIESCIAWINIQEEYMTFIKFKREILKNILAPKASEASIGGFLFVLPKVPIFECQKLALPAAKSSNGLQKPRETPPKMVG